MPTTDATAPAARSPFEPPAPATEPANSPRFPEYSTEMVPMDDGSKLEVVREVIPDGQHRLSDVFAADPSAYTLDSIQLLRHPAIPVF